MQIGKGWNNGEASVKFELYNVIPASDIPSFHYSIGRNFFAVEMKRTVKYFLFVGILFSSRTSFSQSRKIDSLLTLLKPGREDTNRVKHLNAIGWELKNSNPDTAVILSNQALIIASGTKQSPEWKKGIANSLGNLGVYYRLKGDYPKALGYYLKALKIDEELGNKNGMAIRLGNIGLVYRDQADYSNALTYYFKALKLAEELGDKNGISRNLGNIGIVYNDQADYSKALNYYFRALKMKEELGDKNGIAIQLGNIGIVYNHQADYPNALDYYFKALKAAGEIGDKNGIARHLGNIGSVYNDQADYPKALDYYFKALKLREEQGDKNSIAAILGNVGALYTKTAGNMPTQKLRQAAFKDAELYLKKAIAIDDSIGARNDLRQLEELLSRLYDTSGRYQLALEHYKNAMQLKDTLFSEENKKQLIRKEMNFDFEKKELAAKAEQDKKDAIAKEELKQKEQQRNYFIIGFVLVGVLAVFIFRSLMVNQKKNKIITRQKVEVDKAYESLHEKNKEVMDSINYASRIQRALITSEKYFNRKLNEMNGK